MHVEPTYPLPIAAKAAGLKYREFRRHVENDFITLQGCDRKSTGTGVPTGYSRRRILQAPSTRSRTAPVRQPRCRTGRGCRRATPEAPAFR